MMISSQRRADASRAYAEQPARTQAGHKPIVSFDLGGSHVSAAVVHQCVHSIVSVAIPANAGTTEILELVESVGQHALAAAGMGMHAIAGAAMAAPGPFDYTAGTSWMKHKHGSLYGVNLRQVISRSTGICGGDVCFLKDSEAFLRGEVSQGAAEPNERTVGLTLGTGIGSAFSCGSDMLVKGRGVPRDGEIYNLPWEHGIVEDFLSTRFIVNTYKAVAGQSLSVKSIAENVLTNHSAQAVFEQFGVYLGTIMNTLLVDFNPAIIFLGGGISQSHQLFVPTMRKQLTKISPKILVSSSLEQSHLLGAAQFWNTCARK